MTLRHVLDLQPRVGDRLVRAAGGDQLRAQRRERLGVIDQAGLVGHRNERALDRENVLGHGRKNLAKNAENLALLLG